MILQDSVNKSIIKFGESFSHQYSLVQVLRSTFGENMF